jgi:hypothetical protein
MPAQPVRRVSLDPDGTWDPAWIVVVVAASTGVIYEQQCAGLATELRTLEGFLVPLGGQKLDPDAGKIDPGELTGVFHKGKDCAWGSGISLPPERLDNLRSVIASITYWKASGDDELRSHLELDDSRLEALTEAWAPVITADGPGVLMWHNCD